MTIRAITVVLAAASLVCLACVIVLSGDKVDFLSFVCGSPFFGGPSLILGLLARRKTNSSRVSTLLLVATLLSTGLMALIAFSLMDEKRTTGRIDAQSGMGVAIAIVLQWIITIVATIAVWLLERWRSRSTEIPRDAR